MNEEKKVDVVHEEIQHEEEKKWCGKCKEGKMCSKCKMSTKMAIVVAVLIILGALCYYYRGFFIVATVDGSPISRFAVMHEAEKQDGKSILENLITKQIIKSEAMKEKVRVTPADISAEITKIEGQLKAQNTTLDEALKQQGMTRAILEEQILIQKQVEKMVKVVAVTDAEVADYIKANKITIPEGKEVTYRAEIKKQLEQDKFSKAAQAFIEELKAKASIKYLVTY
jgi:foldase protein PrsA